MVKHTQKIRRQKPTNCLSVFDYFSELVLKGLRTFHYTDKFQFHWFNAYCNGYLVSTGIFWNLLQEGSISHNQIPS